MQYVSIFVNNSKDVRRRVMARVTGTRPYHVPAGHWMTRASDPTYSVAVVHLSNYLADCGYCDSLYTPTVNQVKYG